MVFCPLLSTIEDDGRTLLSTQTGLPHNTLQHNVHTRSSHLTGNTLYDKTMVLLRILRLKNVDLESEKEMCMFDEDCYSWGTRSNLCGRRAETNATEQHLPAPFIGNLPLARSCRISHNVHDIILGYPGVVHTPAVYRQPASSSFMQTLVMEYTQAGPRSGNVRS